MKKNLSLRLLLADKDKEITRLKKELEEEKNAYNRMYNMYVEKDNIINESNKMIDKIVEEVYKPVDKEWDNILCIIEDYKLKLQELKGSDKE